MIFIIATKTFRKISILNTKKHPVGKKTPTRCLKDVLPRHLAKTSWRCPKDVLNANLKDIFVRHLEETLARYIVDVLQKTS